MFVHAVNNGIEVPAVGFGAQQAPDDPTDAEALVRTALAAGYRLIDTAEVFGSEAAVGRALRESGIDRASVFVQTKRLPPEGIAYAYDSTMRAFDASLARLGLDYVDAYLIHWPRPGVTAAWKAMEQLHADGRARAIGVSNFSVAELDQLIASSTVVPALNQIEVHPYVVQAELRAAHRARGILTQAWSPLGGVLTWLPSDRPKPPPVLGDPTLIGLAERHGRTAAQIVLRWHLQHGNAVVPKSTRPDRTAANLDVFEFSLSPAEMAEIDALDRGAWR